MPAEDILPNGARCIDIITGRRVNNLRILFILLDVDVKGAAKLKKAYPEAATVFILPPSKTELRKRLKRRGTEDDKHFKIRQKRALSEMKLYRKFEYTIVNKNLNTLFETVLTVLGQIIKTLHCRKNNLDLEQINRIVG